MRIDLRRMLIVVAALLGAAYALAQTTSSPSLVRFGVPKNQAVESKEKEKSSGEGMQQAEEFPPVPHKLMDDKERAAKKPALEFPPIPRKLTDDTAQPAKKPAQEFPPPPRKLTHDTEPLPSAKHGPEGAAILGLARVAVQERDLAEAVRRFDEYLKRYPDDLAVRLELAGVLVLSGERNRAIQEYQRLLSARPGRTDITLGLANVYVQAQQYHKAVPLLRAALQKSPQDLNVAARLARAYALDRNFLHAQEVYERYLAFLRPGDARVPRDLTALLLDLQRPAEALTFLLPQRDKQRDDSQVLVEMARAYARLADVKSAVDAVEDLGAVGKDSLTQRLDLGKALVSSGDHMIAMTVFAQVLAADPDNQAAQLGIAQVHVRQYQPMQAFAMLSTLKPAPALCRQWALAWSEYHQLIGEYVEARRDLTVKSPMDLEARLELAKLLQYIQEYEKAKAQYGAIPPVGGVGRQARLGIASTLYDQRRFDEAVACCEKLLSEDPADGDAMARLMRSLVKLGACDKAVGLGHGFLNKFGNLEPVAVPVQLALGRALLECGRLAEAAREYEHALSRPGGRIPDAWYGLARALAKMNDVVKADQTLVTAYAEPGNETRNRLLIAELFYADYEDRRTEQLARAVLHHEPKNLPALIRLADAQLRQARPSGLIDGVAPTAKLILDLSPTNVRGQLTLARAYSLAQDYPKAVAQYDRLLAVDPTFLVPLLEKARALFSGHQFAASASTYQCALQPGPEELLRDRLGFFLQMRPEFRQQLAPCLDAVTGGHALHGELTKMAAMLPDPEVQVVVRSILLDADARAAEIGVIKLEAEAKCMRDWRNFTAKGLYEKLVTVQPDSIEGFFDLGQVTGQLRQTHNAVAAYGQVLQIDPLHREAAIASDRANWNMSPNVTVIGNAIAQNGRQGLANVGRYRSGALYSYPLGEEDEMISIGASRILYTLPGYTPLWGESVSLNAAKRYDDRLQLYSLANVEIYESRINTRPTYEIGARWVVCDGTTLTANSFLNNVVENGESVQQDIFRAGINIGVESQFTRFWQAGANLRVAYYSDVNLLREFYAHTDLLATLPPNQLKFVARANFLSYQNQTIFAPGDALFGSLHPYFAPGGFAFLEGRVEYTHWMSRDFFTYSNQCYFSIQYGLGCDNNAAVYNDLRFILNWDVKAWLSVGFEVDAQVSPNYNVVQGYGYLVARLPGRR